MQSEATTRMVREVKQPLHTAVACLAPHSSKILSSWRALLRTHKSCIRFVPPLLGLHVAPQRVELFLSDPENYRKESEREGWELANRAVPQECAGIAVGLYVETCLPYLLTGEPKQTEWTQAFARWASVYQFFLLTGYARHEAAARQSLEERVSQAERRSQEFSVQLGEAYEKERRRLAQDLHDEIGHDLIVLKLYTEVIALDLKKGDISQLRRKLKESVGLIQHALKSIRHLTFDLGPAVWNEQGFIPAVRLYARQFAKRTGIRVKLNAARMRAQLPTRCETALYKVLQGALSNVVAHADAHNVKITLASGQDSVTMRIEDDGRGFDVGRKMGVPRQSYGLRAMRERVELLGGAVHFTSRPARLRAEARGTTIEAHLPLQDGEIT
ncbi:MAG TPA: sensor histidine kinase [Bryobacteraceae bacterium]|nr:sensor histidine kinase [Bryobacteraceae bacterium]